MTIDKRQMLELMVETDLENYLDQTLPLTFRVDGKPYELDWAAAEFSDCDRITVADQDGKLYRLEISVLLHELPE
jgi:hypothetical protein